MGGRRGAGRLLRRPLGALAEAPAGGRPEERRLLGLPALLGPLAGALGIAAFAVVVYAGFAGTQTPTANLAPTAVFVLFWVGMAFVSLLLGDVFRAFNPWRAVGRGIGWLAQRVAGERLPEPLPYPERLGRWPAAVGLVAFAWFELVYSGREDPSNVAVAALAYAGVAAARHERLRGGRVVAPGRRLRRLLRPARPGSARSTGAGASCGHGRCSPARPASPRSRGPSR